MEWLSQYVLQHRAENDPPDQRFYGNPPEVNVSTPTPVSSVNYAEQRSGVVVDNREKASSGSVDNNHHADNPDSQDPKWYAGIDILRVIA